MSTNVIVHGDSDFPTEAEIAYAAGLYEGEGCATLDSGSMSVTIGMTDLEPLERFYAIVKVGILKGPFERKGNRKPYWLWRVRSWDQAEYLLEIFQPWLGPRRIAQFETCFIHRPKRLPDVPDCGYYENRKPGNYGSHLHKRRGEITCVGCRAAANTEAKLQRDK